MDLPQRGEVEAPARSKALRVGGEPLEHPLTRCEFGGLMIGAAASSSASAAPANAVESTIRRVFDDSGIPGAVALATTRDRTLYHAAFGVADIETKRPMTEDAMFRIASMTKPITSIAAMQLIERGRFTLDDPVEKHLPEFADLKVFES